MTLKLEDGRTLNANEVVDRMVLEPTIDAYNRRNPRDMTEDEFRNLVNVLRRDRALYIKGKASK